MDDAQTKKPPDLRRRAFERLELLSADFIDLLLDRLGLVHTGTVDGLGRAMTQPSAPTQNPVRKADYLPLGSALGFGFAGTDSRLDFIVINI